jgi:hypothetical protein
MSNLYCISVGMSNTGRGLLERQWVKGWPGNSFGNIEALEI